LVYLVEPVFRKLRNLSLLGGLLGGLIFVLAACQTPTPAPVSAEYPEAVVVQHTPALRIAVPVLQACAAEAPDLALFLEEVPRTAIDLTSEVEGLTRLGLVLGEPAEGEFAVALGEAQIVLIVHPSNPVQNLSADELQNLFSGVVQNWSQIGGLDQAVIPWVLTPADESRQLFDKTILGELNLASQARLAADPIWMLAEVSADPGAIGYLPAAWLDDTVRPVDLQAALGDELRLPLMALAVTRPQGQALNLMICLQNGTGQQILKELFPMP
jgi:DNA-binding transcriptional LysR family regulator